VTSALDVRVAPLDAADEAAVERAAELLVEGFRVHAPNAWPDMGAARAEVRECLDPGWIALGAFGADWRLLGWIGGQPHYAGHAWELHPMVVDERFRRRGIGGLLVRELERRVRARGAVTLFLGTDDEDARTSLGGAELFPNVLGRLRKIRNLGAHPFGAYQRLGFEVVGVIPDANGFGKPDILMAKSLRGPADG
jgi:aminoglycoside 6'-N-acetyltransferase I